MSTAGAKKQPARQSERAALFEGGVLNFESQDFAKARARRRAARKAAKMAKRKNRRR